MYTHTIQVPEAEAASLFAQILGAVVHCHSNNVYIYIYIYIHTHIYIYTYI